MYLDVFRGATLRKAGNTEHLTEEAVSPRRGSITDRDGVELAVSEPAQDLSADPYLVQNPLALSKRLAPLLGQSGPAILEKLSEHSGFVYLARALPQAQAEAVLALKVPGISGTPVMRRVYPRGALAAQVLGIRRHRRTGPLGPGVRAQRAAGGRRRQATRRQRRSRPAALDQRKPARAAGHQRLAHARLQHPGAHRTGAGGGGPRVRTERRHRDRDGPAHRRTAIGRQLAPGQRQRPRRLGGERARGPRRRASTTNPVRPSR